MTRCVASAALAVVVAAGPLATQVDPSGPWRTWTSEHFRVHARAELGAWAEHLVREAERAHRLLAAELRPPRGRIDIALLDNVDFSNGFTAFFPSNRITLFLPAPAGDISLGVYDDWLRLVTTHELVHVFHLDRADGLWRILRVLLGRNPALFPNAYQPSWVTEGLATYYESRLTTAGRLRGGFHAQLLGAASGSARWPGPNDATFGTVAWPAGFRPYAWGSRFFEAAAARSGDSVVPRFVDRTSRQLWPIAISGPLRSAGAAGVDDGWRRLRTHWTRTDGPTHSRVLARGLRADPRPRLSRDGRLLAYVHQDGRHPARVMVLDRSGGSPPRDHVVNGRVDIAWAGDTVYVTQLEFVSPVEVTSDLYRWAPDGRWDRLTTRARLSFPFTFPDGRVAAAATRAGSRVLTVRDGTGWRPLPAPAGDDWGHAAVSPDGARVAVARHAAGRWDVVAFPADAPDRAIRVTDDAALDGDPAWSPDGETLLYVSERVGLPQIYGYRWETGETVRLTDEPTGARDPALAPDGTLVYSTLLDDGYAVVALDGLTPVSAGPVADRRPPDDPPAAGPVAMSSGAYNPWPALLPRFWTPVSHGEGSAGRFFGASTGGSDLIGRFAYAAFATYAPASDRWEAAAAVQHSRWRSFTLDAGVDQTWEFAGFARTSADALVPLAVRERFARLGGTWRWRRWRTAIALRAGAEVEQDAFFNDGAAPLGFAVSNPVFAGGVLTANVVHARRGALSISREDGASATVQYRRRWELDGPGWSDEWRGTLLGFVALPLPGFARWVAAARLRGAVSGGPIPIGFRLGGESSRVLELVPGVGVGGARRSFPLRGYPPGRERFTRVVTGALELRVPLWLVGRSVWKLPIGIDRVSASGFVEAGGGWLAGEAARPTAFRDLGAELVLDLYGGFDHPVRVRGGAAVPLTAGLGVRRGDVRGYVAVGSSF